MKCVADAGETIRKIGKTKWYFGWKNHMECLSRKISLCDIRKRTIPVWLLFLGSLLVITDICIMGWKTGIIVETVPGIILLLLTKMTKAIGMADGIVLIQLGSICRDGQALLIFCLSLIYIFLYSMILYMLRRDRKRRIPYIPFLFLAYLTTWMI